MKINPVPDVRPAEQTLPLLLQVLVPQLGALSVALLGVHGQHVQPVEDGQGLHEKRTNSNMYTKSRWECPYRPVASISYNF